MGENDDLQILIEAALDFAKSMQNISRQLVQLQSQLNDYRLKITAGLDQATTASQIRQDLSKIDRGKPQINLVGKVDRNATKAEVEKAVKSLKGVEVKLSAALDPLDAGKQLQNSLPDVPNIEASATVKVDGAEQVDELSRKLKDAGNNAAGMASKVYLARTALQLLRLTVKKAVDTVTELDACVTDLSVATGQDRDETYKLLESYNELAERIGATTSQIARAADEWLRQGHSLADTTTLIEDAMVLSKISQLDSANATQYLTSAMKGYEIAVQDVLGVVDKLSAVDLVSATNAGELAEAMSRTAVTANMAGVSMDRLLGYIATVGEVTQKSMSSVGEGFKTIFSRMNDIKANKLQLIDEDGTEETLSDVELTLKNVGIDLRATVNEYNNYGDVLDSLAAKWDTLSEVQQNALAKAFAGTRQGENFRVLMENYSSAAEYMQVAANSAGTALDKFSVYEESIEAKAASFTAAMENLTMDTIDSDLVKDLIDVGTAVVDFIDKIGLLKSALITLGAGGLLKGISAISGGFRAAYKDVINLGEAITTLRNVDNLGADTITKLGSLTAGLNDEQIKLVLTSTKLSTAQMQAILTAGGLTSEEAAQKIATLGLASSQKTATETTVDLSGAMTGLRAKIKAAFAGMSTTGKIISVLSLVTTAVSIGVSIWQSYKQSQEEARQAALDAAKEFEQTAQSIEDYKDRVLELKKSLDEGNLSQEEAYNARKELLSIQDEIREAYGKEAEAIDLVSDSAEESADKLNGLTRAMANEKLIEQADQLDKAAREMEKQRSFTVSISHVMTGPGIDDAEPDPEVIRRIEEIVGKYKDAALESWEEMSREGYGAHGLQLEISANAADAKETIVALGTELRELQKELEREGYDLTGTVLKSGDVSALFSDALNDVNEVIEKWGELYDKRAEWKIITDDNYADAMDKINSAGEALQEALASGDDEALAAAIEEINALLLDPEKIDDEGVRNYMQKVIDEMQAEALKYTVQVKLSADVDDDEWTSRVKAAVGRLSGGDGVTTGTDILNAGITAQVDSDAVGATHGYLSDETQAYLELEAAFDEYGLTVEDAIPILEEYGLVTVDATEASEEAKKAVSDLGESFSKLKDLADPLKTAMGEMMSGGGLSSGTAQTIMEKLTEAGLDYVDYLYEENGALKLNTAAWADYIRAVNTANLEGVSEEQAGVLRELYATLTEELAGDLYDEAISKLDDLHEALDGLSDVDTLDIETYEKLRELMPDLIGDVHDVASAQEALTKAIQRGEQEAEAAYGAMLYANQSWVSGAINSSVGLSNALSTYYGKDVENWKANAASKWKVDSALVQNLSELWSKYYNVSTATLEQELKTVESKLKSASSGGLGLKRSTKGKQVSSLADHELTSGLQEQYNELQAVLEMRKNIEEGFKNLLNTSYGGGGVSSGSSGGGSSKEVEAYIADIDRFREAVEALRKAQEEAERLQDAAEEQAGDKEKIELQRQLVDAYRSEQIAIQHLNAARSGYISESVDSLRKLGFAVDYNAETNEFWIENMEHLNELTAASRGEYDSLQEATNALRQETEDLIETLTDLNEENRDGASTWLELRRQAVDCFLNIVDTAHEAVDQIQNVYDVLHQAADEFAANGGYISIDVWQSILKLEPQYLQLLKNENGLWEINEERVNAVIAAKSRQLAVENAMSYVQRLKVAAWAGEIDKLNELIFVNDSATSSTWGLVYAELELMRVMGELDDSQYTAALHNIQAMEDLAENAISHIGDETDSVAKGMESMRDQLEKTKDELEDMQDGAGDLIDYVMDMLKDRIEQQIDLLEEMKDKYSEIIDLKKESLDASKDERDYQKEISKKVKEMAELQERINSLSLDDSRSAQAERAGLLEQMAELQEDLADTQADKAIDAQKEALDKMEEDYHAEKDKEIEALEESISSTQKLYDKAIDYIRNHWDTLYRELIDWDESRGTSLNSEITEAWEAACSAAERYGDFVSAVMGGISNDIDRITSQIEELDTKISNLGSGSSGSGSGLGSSFNTTVSSKGTNSRQTNVDMVKTIVGRMKDLGAQWSTLNGAGDNNTLHQQAEKLAAQLDQYGVHAEYHPADGTWWITRDELDPKNVGKLLHSCYHTGGFVGQEPLKPNEQYIKAENGELMMTARQQDSLVEQINRFETLTKAFQAAAMPTPRISSGGAPSNTAQRIFNSVTNNSRPVNNISINGPTISCVPEKSVESHIKVTRDMMNQIGNLLRRGI